jgi:D-alanine-D-alanine ligase-like ATP-grasp enzyme
MGSSKIFLKKLKNWEYWPTYMFYVPNLPYAFYLALKAKSLTFYTAANPILKSSGNGTESKFESLQHIPKKYKPKTILVSPSENLDAVLEKIELEKIEFPLIVKPDIGFRGLLVQKINTEIELKKYLKKYPLNIIIQEFIKYKNECGIFYYRLPNEKTGHITSITLKKFLSIIGDGKSTLSELILNDERASIYYDIFKDIHREELNLIPKKNKEVLLSSIGNHSKGTQFKNGNGLISDELTTIIQEIEQHIEGWNYGRLDIKYDTFDKVLSDKKFKILEINGIISEPTHVFDASTYSYFDALKAIRKHWKILYNVSTTNHELGNVEYIKPMKFLNDALELRTYIKRVKELSL